MTWTVAKEVQYRELMNEWCPNNTNPNGTERTDRSPVPMRHGLMRVTSRSWRDWFRKRVHWRCWFCDLRAEVVDP